MNRWTTAFTAMLAALVAIAACAAPSGGPGLAARDSELLVAPKRLTIAILGIAKTLSSAADGAAVASTPGVPDLERMVNPGLTISQLGARVPILADAAPSVENGQWRVFPDGSMETTWKIRPGVRWHDGQAFSSEDILFTAEVIQDPELQIFRDAAFASVDIVRAPDLQTVLVTWKRPYILADSLFGAPMPKHVLERPYRENKATFSDVSYWTRDFIGAGAYRLDQWSEGSGMLLKANDGYILGRPKIDEIEVRFIPDSNTLAANVLAGTVDLTIGRSLSLDSATKVGEQWREGVVDPGALDGWIALYPQAINPNPPVMLDVRFRRALVHAIDRQQIGDALMLGFTSVAHSPVAPGQPEYPAVEGSVARYEYDVRRATQIIEDLGFTKGSDGMFKDRTNQTLTVHTQSSVGNDLQVKALYAVDDYWQRLGLAVEPDVVPAQARTDRARRSGRPGYEVQKQGASVTGFASYHGRERPLPENNYVGNNRARYQHDELDALIDRYLVTVPRGERLDIVRGIVRHMTEQLNVAGLIYDSNPILVGHRVQGAIVPQQGVAIGIVHQWVVG